jgi:quinol monooxygenase YgiN
MSFFDANTQDRRNFLKSSGLLFSLGVALPGIAANHHANSREGNSVIEIHTGNTVTVLIGIFTVQPENKQKLIDLFEDGTLNLFAKQPGYISASLHLGADPTKMVLYGQWESPESIDAFRKVPEIGPYFQKIRELATVESIVCNNVPFIHHK